MRRDGDTAGRSEDEGGGAVGGGKESECSGAWNFKSYDDFYRRPDGLSHKWIYPDIVLGCRDKDIESDVLNVVVKDKVLILHLAKSNVERPAQSIRYADVEGL